MIGGSAMASIFKFKLDGKSYSLWICATPKRSYVLEDGNLLPVSLWPAWCEGCQKFVPGEQIFPIEEEDKRLDELEYFAQHPGHIPPDRYVDIKSLPELRVRKRWRQKRVSPAKCLICGSTSITSIWPEPEIDIPGHGRCVGGPVGFADVSSEPPDVDEFFNPEGDRIPSAPRKRKPGAR